jgi:hypothetical protein
MNTRGGRGGGRRGGRGNNVVNNNNGTVNNNDNNGDVNDNDNNNDNNNNVRGRGTGSQNYRDWEVEVLLNILEVKLPLGAEHWETVTTEFNATALTRSIQVRNNYVARDLDSLKNKFKVLKNHKKPTGDPNCPPLVKRAKRIQKEIERKQSTVDFDDDGNIINDDGNIINDDDIAIANDHNGEQFYDDNIDNFTVDGADDLSDGENENLLNNNIEPQRAPPPPQRPPIGRHPQRPHTTQRPHVNILVREMTFIRFTSDPSLKSLCHSILSYDSKQDLVR